jgi:tetratricopeptide (TPR) repeat protein
MLRALVFCLVPASMVLAAGTGPALQPTPPAGHVRTAESVYNEGLSKKAAGQWVDAETDFREATKLKPNFPEAWSELGHALKKRGLYDDSVKAYQEALRLRPGFPQAMEYLGETYAHMGKRAEAEQMLDQLRPIDPKLAAQLQTVMNGGGGSGY